MQEVIHQVQVEGKAYRAFLRAKAATAAAEREEKAAKQACGLPEREELLASLGVPTEEQKVVAVVTDGNGKPIGKLTLSHRKAYVSPETQRVCWS